MRKEEGGGAIRPPRRGLTAVQRGETEARWFAGVRPGALTEDIQYRICVRQAIAAGLRDTDRGQVVSQEEVERWMVRWTEK